MCAPAVFTAGSAQAFAIYNHVDKKVCVQDRLGTVTGGGKYIIEAGGTLNGEHGASFNHVNVVWAHGDSCRGSSDRVDIPKGGYARIYNDKVKVYKHNGDHVETVGTQGLRMPR